MAPNSPEGNSDSQSGGTGLTLWSSLLVFLRRIVSLLRRHPEQPYAPEGSSPKPEPTQGSEVSIEEPEPGIASVELPKELTPILEAPEAKAEPVPILEKPKATVQLPPISEDPKSLTKPTVIEEEPESIDEPAPISEKPVSVIAPTSIREGPRAIKVPTGVWEVPETGEQPVEIQKEQEATKEPAGIPEKPVARKRPPLGISVDLNRPSRRRGHYAQSTAREESRAQKEPPRETRERVESPYVEINLDNLGDDERATQIVFPEQRLWISAELENVSPRYTVELNDEKRAVACKARIRDGYLELQEARLGLAQPIRKFHIVFPEEAGQRDYNYKHERDALFVFSAIGANRGRLLYNLATLPKRPVWVLLDEEYELANESDIEEQYWVWERYKPFRVDLRQSDALAAKNKLTGERISFPCAPTFVILGDQLVEDDFVQEFPLVSGTSLLVEAPYKNELGWDVWIQNKTIGGIVVYRGWTGEEPLKVDLLSALPCDSGEFQVDVWNPDDNRSDATLFFRWVPSLELVYPQELIFPDPKVGHVPSTISVALRTDEKWELRNESGCYLEPNSKNVHEVMVPAERDIVRLSVQKEGEDSQPIGLQVTFPRPKWKTASRAEWHSTIQLVAREHLVSGSPFDVIVCTNDRRNKYDIRASLDRGSEQLQAGQFVTRGGYYRLGLNEFFDTIHKHKQDELALRLDISKKGEPQVLGSLEVLHFAAEPVIRDVILPDLTKKISTSDIRRAIRRARTAYPEMRWACDALLQYAAEKPAIELQASEEFVVQSMSLLRFIVDMFGTSQVSGHKRWGRKLKRRWMKRIDQVRRRYPNQFDAAYDRFARR